MSKENLKQPNGVPRSLAPYNQPHLKKEKQVLFNFTKI
nr:hypothetical protein [Providencia sp.]UNJ80149.1 hypothetical protein [Providencia sp.]